MKYQIKLTKKGDLKFISHLDWQNTLLKLLNRTGLPLKFSEGFNPTPKISFSPALGLFIESECEILNIELTENLSASEVAEKLEKNTLKGLEIKNVTSLENKPEALDILCQWAKYEICPVNSGVGKIKDLVYIINEVLSKDDLFIEKINKKGLKKLINVKPLVKSVGIKEAAGNEKIETILKTGQSELPSLRPDEFLKTVFKNSDNSFEPWNIKRTAFYDKEFKVL